MSKTKLEIDIGVIRAMHHIDLAYLVGWCQRQLELQQFVLFADWLLDFATAELNRREDASREQTMLSLPADWSGEAISDALLGSFILVRHPCSPALAVFADALHLRCVGYAASVLQELKVSYT